ncbi:MAG: hypothetical protein CMJ16_05715 [Peredibacter sp.]|nr:hypothetical protein [Peredibacter sp.]
MSKELKDKLKEEVDQASWAMLEDHYKRGAVFLVNKVELEEVGVALATDDTQKVKLMLDNEELVKVDEPHQKEWEKTANEKNFKFLIIQPYVLIQLLN